MKALSSWTLAATLALGSACQNSQPPQSFKERPCPSQTEIPPKIPQGITPEDLVLSRSVLLQNNIDYFRRQLTAKMGEEKAAKKFYDCYDKKCSEEVSPLSDALYKKVTKKEMDICFQGGDINPECMDATVFRRFGRDYLIYMETKNRCSRIIAACLDKELYPTATDPYDPHGRDPLDPWNMK